MDWQTLVYFKNVLLGTCLLGVVGGVMGSFALLRRQSLLGDALAHAALPGVCVAFIVTGHKSPIALLIGAAISGLIGALVILLIARGSRVKEDSAIGIVLSVFFGIGIVLLTWIQHQPSGNQSGLDTFLFGQAATLMERDVKVFAGIAFVVLAAIILFYKEFKLLCFDRAYGAVIGFPMRSLEVLITCLLVIVVVIGLQTVGVVLMVASLVIPAAAARQWTSRFGWMLLLSGAIGGLSSIIGVFLSASVERLPTGPTIVLIGSSILVASLVFSPHRGAFWHVFRERQLSKRIRRENLLKDLYVWGERRGSWDAFVSLAVLMGLRGQSGQEIRATAGKLLAAGFLDTSGDGLRLSPAGLFEAERVVRNHRVWELYLARRLDLPIDHVHRDAEDMEHALTDEVVLEFERLLGYPTVDPHGRAIPPRRAKS